jgi:hypothetical protein
MILRALTLLLSSIIKLYLLYVCIVWILGISFWFFSLFTRRTIKLSEVLVIPFKKRQPFNNNNKFKKGK